jgi:uncharacterized protein (TIGR02452 family)
MNRLRRAAIAHETLRILNNGRYTTPAGRVVTIADALRAAMADTVMLLPDESVGPWLAAGQRRAQIAVTNRSTLSAAYFLSAQYGNVTALNFASAKHPGGGFLAGARAQEESLARASGIYACLKAKFEFYAHHRERQTSLYSDRVIYSPRVPVFRDEAGTLLDQPWLCSFITAAAVNAGAVRQNEPAHAADIEAVMRRRARKVLEVAAAKGADALILGAWGCGVFKNEPRVVAGIFRDLLRREFATAFAYVEFAVLDHEPGSPVHEAFAAELMVDGE